MRCKLTYVMNKQTELLKKGIKSDCAIKSQNPTQKIASPQTNWQSTNNYIPKLLLLVLAIHPSFLTKMPFANCKIFFSRCLISKDSNKILRRSWLKINNRRNHFRFLHQRPETNHSRMPLTHISSMLKALS